MKAAKYILFVAGILGVVGLFLPLFAVGRGPLRFELSARELTFGLSRTHRVIDQEVPALLERRVPADWLETRDDVRTIAHASRGAALAFVPAAMMLVISITALWRRRFGRGVAAIALVFGAASIAAYLAFRYGIAYGEEEEPLLVRARMTLQLGGMMLIVAGVGGVVSGLLGVTRPDLPTSR